MLTASTPQTDRAIVLIALIALREGCKNHTYLILKFSNPKDLENSFPAFSFQLAHDTTASPSCGSCVTVVPVTAHATESVCF